MVVSATCATTGIRLVPEQPKAKLMARLRELRQSQGWARIEVWVPKHLVPKVRAYVKRLSDSATAGKERK